MGHQAPAGPGPCPPPPLQKKSAAECTHPQMCMRVAYPNACLRVAVLWDPPAHAVGLGSGTKLNLAPVLCTICITVHSS